MNRPVLIKRLTIKLYKALITTVAVAVLAVLAAFASFPTAVTSVAATEISYIHIEQLFFPVVGTLPDYEWSLAEQGLEVTVPGRRESKVFMYKMK